MDIKKIRKYENKKIKLIVNKRKNTNMLYSLFLARNILNKNRRVIISYGDIIYEKIVDKLLKSRCDISSY